MSTGPPLDQSTEGTAEALVSGERVEPEKPRAERRINTCGQKGADGHLAVRGRARQRTATSDAATCSDREGLNSESRGAGREKNPPLLTPKLLIQLTGIRI